MPKWSARHLRFARGSNSARKVYFYNYKCSKYVYRSKINPKWTVFWWISTSTIINKPKNHNACFLVSELCREEYTFLKATNNFEQYGLGLSSLNYIWKSLYIKSKGTWRKHAILTILYWICSFHFINLPKSVISERSSVPDAALNT